MRSAGRIVAEVLALVEETLKPGVSTAELDRARRARTSAPRRACRRSSTTSAAGATTPATRTRTRPRPASRSTTRSSTASPATARSRPGQLVSVDVGVIYDGWHGDGARTFICGGPEAGDGRGARPRRGDPAVADGRHRGGRSPGNRIGDISAAVEDVASPAATASSASTSGTASAPRCTRTRRSRTSARARRASSSCPATAWPSSRCSTLGLGGDPDARRRLDGRHLGRVAGRPLRAHHRGHRRRARDPHDGLR